MRYNGYPAADLMGEADPRMLSSAQALAVVEGGGAAGAARGIGFEWTDLSYQQANQGNAAIFAVRSRCCWRSWCWRPCTRAGRCRWRSS
jgi:multidrug efflux pump subunit AcrB